LARWYHEKVLNIYLVGFMGAGKTAVGRVVASRTGRDFLDLDTAVEARLGASIRRIFATRGEQDFRTAETAELRRASRCPNLVVATGGGLFADRQNREMIRSSGGISVFLDLPWDVLRQRIGRDDPDRPKWVDEDHALRLLNQRRPGYLTASIHLELSGHEAPDEVADSIVALLTEASCAS
jgi:shikimate kinase